MADEYKGAVGHVNRATDPARRITDFLTNLGNMKPIVTLADMLSQGSNPGGSPASTTSQQVGPYQGPMATPDMAPAAAPQPGMMEQVMRYLGLQ